MGQQGKWDRLFLGGHLATLAPDREGFGEIRDGAVACHDGRIAWVGRERDLPDSASSVALEVVELNGCWVTAGLIDCHTHLVFGGDRSREFEARLRGVSYEEIARQGGGIRTTMRATRGASFDDLLQSASARLNRLEGEGVTTVEVKSGYGLDTETELRMLRVARELGRRHSADVVTTFLGAHVVPPEFEGRRAAYVDLVVEEMLPAVGRERLADAMDAFCDAIAFTPAECEHLLLAGRGAGMDLRLHADQLSDQGAAELAARLGARSADHLERTSLEGVRAMGRAGTVAVLLPGAFYFLKDNHPPPVRAFREEGVPMAIGTDLNPGSSPLNSILAAMNLGCVLFGLTPLEALRAVTRNAATVLGLGHDRGTLEEGRTADLAIWSVDHPRELSYWMGRNPLWGVVKGGALSLAHAAHAGDGTDRPQPKA